SSEQRISNLCSYLPIRSRPCGRTKWSFPGRKICLAHFCDLVCSFLNSLCFVEAQGKSRIISSAMKMSLRDMDSVKSCRAAPCATVKSRRRIARQIEHAQEHTR